MRVFLTFDVEHDCPPFLNSYRGIEEGLPKILDLLKKENVTGTFFVTGGVARKFPKIIERTAAFGHEIGCHGDTHARFDKMTEEEALSDLKNATATLSKFGIVTGFRAPNLQLPEKYLTLLNSLGYKIDSSEGKHKNPFLKPMRHGSILRVPVTTTSIILRLPDFFRNRFLKRFKDPVVLMFHPWEVLDLRGENLRWDCRFRTGGQTLNAINEIIEFYKKSGAKFLTLREFANSGISAA